MALLPASLLAAAALAAATPDAGAAAAPAADDVSRLPFSADTIREVMARHMPQVQACYEETLAGRKKVVEGRLATTFVITAEGMVREARVARKGTTLREPKLHRCVEEVLASLTFPRPPDGREHPVEYPFNLKAIR